MKVYGFGESSSVQCVLLTVAERGAEIEQVWLDGSKGEHKSAAHLERQPFGQVPAFEDDDGFRLFESRAIMRYLDDKLPGKKLTPSDPQARAVMEQWISVEHHYFAPHAVTLLWQKVLNGHYNIPGDDKKLAEARAGINKVLDVAEKQLVGKSFLCGAYSLADITWTPYLGFIFRSKEDELVNSRPHVAAWWERLSTRPSWKKLSQYKW